MGTGYTRSLVVEVKARVRLHGDYNQTPMEETSRETLEKLLDSMCRVFLNGRGLELVGDVEVNLKEG